MDLAKTQHVYLGRQPILDGQQKIFAYELLFRSENSASCTADDYLATTTVIINTLSQIGIDSVLDDHYGFINVSAEVLKSDVLDLLPPDRFVLEILETVDVDELVIARCHELKAKGFKLAIDDYIYQPGYYSLFKIVDYVKFDVQSLGPSDVAREMAYLSQWPHLKFLAEKVEERSQFEHYRRCGLELFQGYFFAKPLLMTRARLNPTQMILIKVLNMLQDDGDVEDIYIELKSCPQLSIGLLRLVNGVGNNVAMKISSLKQAMIMLGRLNLQHWIQLLLYAPDGSGITSPLMEMAAIRAKTMAALCDVYPDFKSKRKDISERAFMVGVLSLVDAAIGIDKPTLIAELNLSEDIASALLNREGFLGDLLCLAENFDTCDFDAMESALVRHSLSTVDLQRAQIEALQWFHRHS